MLQIDRILVPTDFSENAKAAVLYASELGRKFNAELHLLNVVDNIDVFSMELESVAASGLGYNAVEAQEQASRLLAELPGEVGHDCRIVRSTELGNPTTEVTRYAERNHIDLIVISTHGRTGLRHLLMGSVAESVVRKAPCPVLTVRPEGHQFTNLDSLSNSESTEIPASEGQ